MAIALAHGALRDFSAFSGDGGTGVLARRLTDGHILGTLVEAKSQGLIAEVKLLLNALIIEAEFWMAEPLLSSVLQLKSIVAPGVWAQQ